MRPDARGFALVLVLSLLGLLVLLAYALTALGKVDAQLAATTAYQTQARQNALLGLQSALGTLQRLAGPDDRVTGMAGVTGVPAGAANPARHWCGVWNEQGTFLGWLASGADGAALPSLEGPEVVALVGPGTVGGDATDREHVRAIRLPVNGAEPSGVTPRSGHYAYWVGDEGVKLSFLITDATGADTGQRHAVDVTFTGVTPGAAALTRLVAYEQISLAGGTAAQRQIGFHSHGLSHRQVIGPNLVAGQLNVNSSSARYWTGVAATYNRLRPSGALPVANPAAFGQSLRASMAGALSDVGRPARGPFLSASAFLNSNALSEALTDGGGSLLDFGNVMLSWLTARSDTFRIRAYGDAVNPAIAGQVEATARCEAIVQRLPDLIDAPTGPLGRRFVIVSFRWLVPDDI